MLRAPVPRFHSPITLSEQKESTRIGLKRRHHKKVVLFSNFWFMMGLAGLGRPEEGRFDAASSFP